MTNGGTLQIPRHDIDIEYVQTELSTVEAKQMADFIKETKDNVSGMIIDCAASRTCDG